MGTSLGEGYWFTGSGYWFWRKGGLLVTGCGYWFWLLVLEETRVIGYWFWLLVLVTGYMTLARAGHGHWKGGGPGRGQGGPGNASTKGGARGRRSTPRLQKFKPKGLGILEDDSVSE